jgi:hypothetical protein
VADEESAQIFEVMRVGGRRVRGGKHPGTTVAERKGGEAVACGWRISEKNLNTKTPRSREPVRTFTHLGGY